MLNVKVDSNDVDTPVISSRRSFYDLKQNKNVVSDNTPYKDEK